MQTTILEYLQDGAVKKLDPEVTERFGYVQSTPASVWVIQHNLNITSPVVEIWSQENGNGPLVIDEAYTISYTSPTSIMIDFDGRSVSGQVLIT